MGDPTGDSAETSEQVSEESDHVDNDGRVAPEREVKKQQRFVLFFSGVVIIISLVDFFSLSLFFFFFLIKDDP